MWHDVNWTMAAVWTPGSGPAPAQASSSQRSRGLKTRTKRPLFFKLTQKTITQGAHSQNCSLFQKDRVAFVLFFWTKSNKLLR